MRRVAFWVYAFIPFLLAALVGCSVDADKNSGSPDVSETTGSAASEMAEPNPKLPDLSKLDWMSNHVTHSLKMPFFEAGKNGEAPEQKLPKEIADFFQTEYPMQFDDADCILPYIGCSVDTYDFDGDDAEDYVVRVWPRMNGQLLPDAYLFLAKQSGYLRIFLGLPQYGTIDLLDSRTNGMPDVIYSMEGRKLVYNGKGEYQPEHLESLEMFEMPDSAVPLFSWFNLTEGKIQIEILLKHGIPEGCRAAAYFKTKGGLLETPYVWLEAAPDQPNGACYTATVKVKDGVALGETNELFPDEIKYIPIA